MNKIILPKQEREVTDIDLLKIKKEIDKIILENVKKEDNIIYGAQSIKKQTGILGRKTFDFDIFSNDPKSSARKTEKQIEKITSRDDFFTKQAKHKGTHKIIYKGQDNEKNTKDDISIVDFTEMPKPKPPVKKINGVNYRSLTQEAKAKRKSIEDPEFEFRHAKDTEDLERIKLKKVIFD